MTVTHGMVLKRSILKASNDSESLLCRFFGFQLILFDLSLGHEFLFNFSHLETKVSNLSLSEGLL